MTEASINIYKELYRPAAAAGKEAILKTLAYFDVFQYPLTAAELKQFARVYMNENDLHNWLSDLRTKELIFCINGYYLLHNDPALCLRRKNGNERAGQLLKKAEKIARFLYLFPFVKAVGISGSLSKNFADEKADIDFFIITQANRLWIARTFMHFFKKFTFLTGRQHYYCMNYYLDEAALRLDDRNIFSASEIKTLLPVCGEGVMKDFFGHNQWADDYLPACDFRTQTMKDPKVSWLKRTAEGLLNSKAGDRLETFFMRLTQKRWNKKEERGKRNEKGLTMGLISGKHFARSNPGGLQEKILNAYRQRVIELLRKHSQTTDVLLPL